VKIGLEKWIVIVTVVSAALLQLIDTSIVNVTLLQMMGNLGATLGEISWVITAYAAANVVMIAMAGWLGAKFGRRNYFAASIIVFTVASVFCGLSTNVWMLVFFRFIQGMGGGGLLSTSQAIIVETFPKEELGLANAIYGMGVIIGPAIGPAMGGWLTDNLSWHWVFFINIPIGIAATVMTLLYVKEPLEKHAARGMDWAGIGLLVLGVGSLQVVLERGDAEGWFESRYITVLTVAAVIGVIGFIWRELTTPHPVVDLKLLRIRSFGVGSLFNFILGFGLYGSVFIIPVFAQNFLGFTATDTGMLLIPGSLATALAMPLVGKALQKKVPAHLFSGLGFLMFFGFTLMLSGLNAQSGTQDFFWPLIVRGVALGFIFIPLTTLSLIELKGKDIPQGTGFTNMIRQLGGAFGVALMATFIERRTTFHRSILAEHVNAYNPEAVSRLQRFTGAFLARGDGLEAARHKALAMLNGAVGKQAALLSYLDAFYVVGFFFLLCLPMLLLFRGKKDGKPVDVSHAMME
jgi:DHA2 family multidrug resistance protein